MSKPPTEPCEIQVTVKESYSKQKPSKSKNKKTVWTIKKIDNRNRCHNRGAKVKVNLCSKEKVGTTSTIRDIRSQVTIVTEDMLNNLVPGNYKKATMTMFSKLILTNINLYILTKIKLKAGICKSFSNISAIVVKNTVIYIYLETEYL